MPLSLGKKSSLIAQSETQAVTLACARIGGINLAQGICDTEMPLPVRTGAQERLLMQAECIDSRYYRADRVFRGSLHSVFEVAVY